jgi:hypothetical protein
VTEVPGYEIIDVLGRGGFGVVYRARQLSVDREVAVKIDTRVILDDRDQRRFLREVKAAGRLSGHPHVVEIHDAGVLADSRPYLVMELCPGGSLAGRAPMPPREVAEIGQKIADALAAAHDLGVLHRDIKPGNILVKRYGTVGLADFGLAALVEAGRDTSVTLAALTPAYAAPEAFHLHPPTPRSDVYALAATLYTLLAGFPPRFPAEGELSVPEIMARHADPVLDVAGAPPQLMAVLRRGLAIDPAHRYPEAAALRADLSQLTVGDFSGPRHAVTTATPTVADALPSAPPPLGQAATPDSVPAGSPRRRATLLIAAVLAVVLVLAGVWYFAVADDGQGGGPEDPADSYGIATVTEDCPAAAIEGAQARCAERAECWSGMVVIQGEVNSIRELACEEGHAFETFAIALVPPDVADPYRDVLEAHATVMRVCSTETLLASRFGDALEYGAERWDVSVLPPTPDDRKADLSVYRCVGTIIDVEGITGSVFRPR